MKDWSDYSGGWDRDLMPSNVTVGARCYLEGRHIFDRFRSTRRPGMVIGSDVTVYTWTTFNVEPTGYIEIGDGCVIVGGVFMSADSIILGSDVVVSHHVTIADSDFHPINPSTRRADAIANAPGSVKSARPAVSTRPVVIEDGVWIGIGALILKGVTIGHGARIGPGSVITHDVPANSRWEGNPAREIGRS